MDNIIKKDDFSCVGLVAKHCDLEKLCLAIEESKTFDLIPLFCFDFVNDVLSKDLNIEGNENYKSLWDGGIYEVENKSYSNLGFKKVWVYYAYARYLLINQYNDTANGTVSKENEWSKQVPIADIRSISNQYRDMGNEAFKSVQSYLCRNKEAFLKFDSCNCRLDCGCSDVCSCGKTKKMTGFKFKTIRK